MIFRIHLLGNHNINGAILAILAALSFSISMSLAKHLNTDIPTTLVIFIKSCFGLFFFSVLLIKNKILDVKTKKLPLHILRIILNVGGMFCTYYAYRNLPISFATSIGMTGPLFTTILSIIILKERIKFWKWILIIWGYIGIILVIRPTTMVLDIGMLSALLANILAACCIIIVKTLSRYDSTITIMLYSNVGITITLFLLNTHGWSKSLDILDITDVVILSLTGLLGVFTQFCSFSALKHSKPSFLAPFEYTRIFFAIIIGVLVFQESPDLYIIAGSIIIVSSTYLITHLENNNL